jgi:hypothetical protein
LERQHNRVAGRRGKHPHNIAGVEESDGVSQEVKDFQRPPANRRAFRDDLEDSIHVSVRPACSQSWCTSIGPSITPVLSSCEQPWGAYDACEFLLKGRCQVGSILPVPRDAKAVAKCRSC